MKRLFTTMALMATASAFAATPSYTLRLDVQHTEKDYTIKNLYVSDTPIIRAYFFENGATWNCTGWGGTFWYGTNGLDSVSLVEIGGTTNGVYMDFTATAQSFPSAGTYLSGVTLTNNADNTLKKTWGQGKLIVKKSPGAGASTTLVPSASVDNTYTNWTGTLDGYEASAFMLLPSGVAPGDVFYVNTSTNVTRLARPTVSTVQYLQGSTNATDAPEWATVSGIASTNTDHGALRGLGDDDHAIYVLADGTRDITGDIDVDDGVGGSPVLAFINGNDDEGSLWLDSGGNLQLLAPGKYIHCNEDLRMGDNVITNVESIYLRDASSNTIATLTSTGFTYGTNTMSYDVATDILTVAGVITGGTVYATHLRGVAVTNDSSPTDDYILKYDSALGLLNWEADGGGASLTQEQVEDYAGAMVSGNTETDITVTYQDGDGTIDFVVDAAVARDAEVAAAYVAIAGGTLSNGVVRGGTLQTLGGTTVAELDNTPRIMSMNSHTLLDLDVTPGLYYAGAANLIAFNLDEMSVGIGIYNTSGSNFVDTGNNLIRRPASGDTILDLGASPVLKGLSGYTVINLASAAEALNYCSSMYSGAAFDLYADGMDVTAGINNVGGAQLFDLYNSDLQFTDGTAALVLTANPKLNNAMGQVLISLHASTNAIYSTSGVKMIELNSSMEKINNGSSSMMMLDLYNGDYMHSDGMTIWLDGSAGDIYSYGSPTKKLFDCVGATAAINDTNAVKLIDLQTRQFYGGMGGIAVVLDLDGTVQINDYMGTKTIDLNNMYITNGMTYRGAAAKFPDITTLTADSVDASHMADADHGDFTWSSGTATLDADVVAAAEMADADHGDVSWSSGVATVEDFTLTGDGDANGNGLINVDVLQLDTNSTHQAAVAGHAIMYPKANKIYFVLNNVTNVMEFN